MPGCAALPELAAYGAVPDPEMLALLRSVTAGTPLTEGARALVAVACAEGVDPGLVRLLPLLHDNPAAAALPPSIRTAIADTHRLAKLRFILMERAARNLTQLFAEAGIAPLFLKGFALASQIYESPALRPMGDLDLAVPGADFVRATALLAGLGYREKSGRRMGLGPGLHALTFKHAKTGEIVDLHRFVLACSRWDGADAGFWARALPMPIGDATARTLAPEDHLLHGCLHGHARNVLQSPFRWMADAHRILVRNGAGFRWNLLLEEAERQRCGGVLAAALSFLATELGAPVPAGITAALAATKRRPEDDEYFRLYGTMPDVPSVALRARALWASYRRQEAMPRADPIRFLRWLARRWDRGSLAGAALETLRRLPRARDARSKQIRGAALATHTRALRIVDSGTAPSCAGLLALLRPPAPSIGELDYVRAAVASPAIAAEAWRRCAARLEAAEASRSSAASPFPERIRDLLPLMAERTGELGVPLPPWLAGKLKAAQLLETARQQALFALAAEILSRPAMRGADPILLGGLGFAQAAYRSPMLRHTSSLVFLLPSVALARAAAQSLASGGLLRGDGQGRGATIRLRHGSGMAVTLHGGTCPAPADGFTHARLSTTAVRGAVNGVPLLYAGAADALGLLAIGVARLPAGASLLWLADAVLTAHLAAARTAAAPETPLLPRLMAELAAQAMAVDPDAGLRLAEAGSAGGSAAGLPESGLLAATVALRGLRRALAAAPDGRTRLRWMLRCGPQAGLRRLERLVAAVPRALAGRA